MRGKWENWMINGYHPFSKSGSQKKASYTEIAQWIVECWYDIFENCIQMI